MDLLLTGANPVTALLNARKNKMREEQITKAGFYINWYNIAKRRADPARRAAFYDMIFQYAFEGIEPGEDNPEYELFQAVKASIEKDINDKINGSKGGKKQTNASPKSTEETAKEALNTPYTSENLTAETSTPKKILSDTPLNPPLITNDNDNVKDNDKDIDNVNDKEKVKVKVKVKEKEKDNIGISADSLSPHAGNYAQKIFEIFSNAGLPCNRNNYLSFLQSDFRIGLQYLHSAPETAHIHSSDVIGACQNYIKILNDASTWHGYKNKLSFPALVKAKFFTKLLPDNFYPDNFKDFSSPPQQENTSDKIYYEMCPRCNARTLYWNSDKQLFVCESCKSELTYEEGSK